MSSLSSLVSTIRTYQQNPYVHPLTCGNDSNHTLLQPFEEDGQVILKCQDCEYVQAVSDHLKEHVLLLAGYDPSYIFKV